MFNGIGTYYLNWEHCSDGTALATKWFAIFYLPVIPLRREQISVVSSGNDTVTTIPLLFTSYTLRDEYRVMGRVPMDWSRVVWTYVFAYLWMPILLAAPLLVIVPLGTWALKVDDLRIVMSFFTLCCFYGVLYVPGFLAHQLHKSRTGR